MAMYHQQSDIRLLGNRMTSIPRIVPGRQSTEDFVFFIWHHEIDPKDYTIIVQANDTAGPEWRSIGPLRKEAYLPQVQFCAHAHLAVVPTHNKNLPSFIAHLNRASTYEIPIVNDRTGGLYHMNRHGITTSSVNSTPWMGGE